MSVFSHSHVTLAVGHGISPVVTMGFHLHKIHGSMGPREWFPKSSRAPLVSSRGTEASDGPAISTSDMARKAQRGGLRDHTDHVSPEKWGLNHQR